MIHLQHWFVNKAWGSRLASSLSIEDRISQHYSQLSEKLQQAADFIVENPLDVASRSLRSIAATAGLSPATFSRLAKALSYQSYEEMREQSRQAVSGKLESFSERAVRIRAENHDSAASGFLQLQALKCQSNLDALFNAIDEKSLTQAAQLMLQARKVCLVGSLGSAGMLDYFAYMSGWFLDNWLVAGKNGVSLPSMMANVSEEDVVIILSLAPFATRSIAACNSALERGTKVIVITDSRAFPKLSQTQSHFIVKTESSNFFSSYISVTVLFEALVSMMVSLSGEEADQAISRVENESKRLA